MSQKIIDFMSGITDNTKTIDIFMTDLKEFLRTNKYSKQSLYKFFINAFIMSDNTDIPLKTLKTYFNDNFNKIENSIISLSKCYYIMVR
jgi:hypothetical protein